VEKQMFDNDAALDCARNAFMKLVRTVLVSRG
jgi:hypothetical protein